MKWTKKSAACLTMLSLTGCPNTLDPFQVSAAYCQTAETITFPESELPALRKAPEAARGILRENTKRERLCLLVSK